MAKNKPIGIRFEPEERTQLEAWAAEDDRPLASLIRKIVIDKLKERKA
jgi:hypothetical protein